MRYVLREAMADTEIEFIHHHQGTYDAQFRERVLLSVDLHYAIQDALEELLVP